MPQVEKRTFKRFVEVGRVVLLSNGPYEGKLAVIVEIIDHNRALIEGPANGVPRHVATYRNVVLTPYVLSGLPRAAGTKALAKVWTKSGVEEKWQESAWAKKRAAKERRRNTTDFERFEIMLLKQKRRLAVGKNEADVSFASGASRVTVVDVLNRPPGVYAARRAASRSTKKAIGVATELHTILGNSRVLQSSLDAESALINSLEAEEERLVLSLSKKLEKVRRDSFQLQDSLEKENEQLFNKLAQLKTSESTSPVVPSSPTIQPNFSHLVTSADPLHPQESTVTQALQAENRYLRENVANLMRDRERSSQTVDLYRSELIELRQRLGLDVGDLIGTSDSDTGRRRLSQSLRTAVPPVPHNSFASAYYPANRRNSSGFQVGSPPTYASFGQASTPLTPSSPAMSIASLPATASTAQTTPGRPVQTIAEAADHLRAETADGSLTPPRHLFVGSPGAHIKAPPPTAINSGANSVSSSYTDPDDFRRARSRSSSESRGSSARVGEVGQFRRARGASGASADRAAAQRVAQLEGETVEESALE